MRSPAVAPPAGIQTCAPFLGIAASLLGRGLNLLGEQIVLCPYHRDLLTEELLDSLEIERARLVYQADGLAGRSGPGGTADAVQVVLRILRQVPVDRRG